MDGAALPRLVAQSLAERLRVMPAVVVTGARQTGKSTLAQELAPGERRYFSLDDLDVVDAARRDPDVLVGGAQPVTFDEVQREPDLLRAVKRAIDRQRRPGQFLLTGSASSSTRRSSGATWRWRSRPCIATSTCWRSRTCWCGCPPTP
jgi:predicted AAA+ superfamily ATPase